MQWRSISFHMGGFDTGLIRTAARLGYNDVCFQTEGNNRRLLADLASRAEAAQLPALLRDCGMSATVWVHEFDEKRDHLGGIALENEALWTDLDRRYEELMSSVVPWVDRYVLTVAETAVNVDDRALLERVVAVIHAVCRRHGKELVLRSFVHEPSELAEVVAAIDRLPADIPIMTKCVPQDWMLGAIHDPLIGAIGARAQYIELDIAGEYWRGDLLPHYQGAALAAQFAHWTASGCTGFCVRVDRLQRPGGWWQIQVRDYHLRGQAQEADLHLLAGLADGSLPADDHQLAALQAARQWAAACCPDAAGAEALAQAIQATGAAMREATTTAGFPFGVAWLRIPASWSMNCRHAKPADSRATRYADAEDVPYRSPWHTKASPHRWDAELVPRYHSLRRGETPWLEEKQAALEAIDRELEAGLAGLEAAVSHLPDAVHCFFRFMLQEARAYTAAAGACQCFWLAASRWLYSDDEATRSAARATALACDRELATAALRAAAHLDVEHAGRLWRQQGFEHLDLHGFRAYCRAYWYELFQCSVS